MEVYAHSPSELGGKWETLEAHAQCVARTARRFSSAFGVAEFGEWLGLLHDLGKAKPAFQRRLRGDPTPVGHAAEGALFVRRAIDPGDGGGLPGALAETMALAIAGHHAGLANVSRVGGGRKPLERRLEDAERLEAPAWLSLPPPTRLPSPLAGALRDPFGRQFLARMLLSCLVDADRLETEAFYAGTADVERGWRGDPADLRASLDTALKGFGPPRTDVARLRDKVTVAAREAAVLPPGLFSLSVPTGGGKTLASMAFALDHMAAHGLRRVVHVAPFTAIIEQTADVLRGALGDPDAVLEHHSAYEPRDLPVGRDPEDEHAAIARAAENWDRPVVVTTAVQLFESLFAADTRRCRKLHRLTGSVIVLDEAQAIPLPVLRPCMAALNELARAYGASVVLCTATQPAVTRAAGARFPEALEGVREIAPDPRALHRCLDRVTVEVAGTLLDGEVVDRLEEAGRGLAIVNSRRHARDLYAEMSGVPGARHLTTAMTGAHRRAVLAGIRDDLAAKRPCAVVSTSLIEAGVDVSFPLVLRAMAGLDSIAQAAGRCNRNGELGPRGGRIVVFEPEDGKGRAPPPELRRFAEVARAVLPRHASDPMSGEAVADYFRELLWLKGPEQLDAREVRIGSETYPGIMAAIEAEGGGAHASVAEAFRLIDETTAPVIVPHNASEYGASGDVMSALRHATFLGGLRRALQPHTVPVPHRARLALIEVGAVEIVRADEFGDEFAVLANASLYNAASGLDWNDPTFHEAEGLIV